MFKFGGKYIIDSKTGLSRSEGDTGRSGLHGPLTYIRQSSKNTFSKIISRCPQDCPICHGEEPGCQGGWERKEKNLSRYRTSIDYAEQQLRKENSKYEKHLVFFRALAFLCYLRAFTFSSRYPSRVFFSLYYQSLAVDRNPYYPVKWVAFQNRLDSFPFLTWKREKRFIVLSPKQRKSLICLDGSTRFLVMHLVSANQRCEYLRIQILRRLFGQKSIRRLLQAGGLDPNDFTHQCCTKFYFGE
jgi:hypothetical protein